MKLLSEGSWWLKSPSDPRWNVEGRGDVGGFMQPQAAKDAVERLKKEIGCEPPDDLQFGYMKD